ncbi:hypothetical protein OH76DRAFT_1352266 [Lentinus brumalis]|uniref:F-box domain-containing protein n=1 Tax=Lentinus brumalis TaxID=2498619 RepID=A0A371D7G2_9APHY|nr:hypothetical protein OH76DRAFT_1352266 [Polyporus brumalis]
MPGLRSATTSGSDATQRGTLLLRDEGSILSFVMSATSGSSESNVVHCLHISTGALSNNVAQTLAAFVACPPPSLALTHLQIDDAEDFLGSHRDLVNALARLSTIRNLSLGGVGERARALLQRMTIGLVSADLDMLPEDDARVARMNNNPIKLLRGSQDSLHLLFGKGCDIRSPRDASYQERFPFVRIVKLEHLHLPVTADFVRVFPNLARLCISIPDEVKDRVLGPNYRAYAEYRNVNILAQLDEGSWNSLDACSATLDDHFLLGLTCPVTKLRISGNYMNTAMLRAVLANTRPEYLGFRWFDANIFSAQFATVLSRSYIAQLRCLEFTLCLGGVLQPAQINVGVMLDTIIKVISSLSIRSFGLFLGSYLRSDSETSRRYTEPLCEAERYLLGLDVTAVAQRFKDAVPGLEVVVVAVFNHRACPFACAKLGAGLYPADVVESTPLKTADSFM